MVALHVGDKFLDAFIIFLQFFFCMTWQGTMAQSPFFLGFVVVEGDG